MEEPAKPEFRVLGQLEVLLEGTPLELGGPRANQRVVLACLLVHAGEVVSVDRLIDSLWGESAPATAKTIVQGHVSQLRRLLEPERANGETGGILVTHAAGYELRVEEGTLDRDRFDALLQQGRRERAEGRFSLAAELLGEALSLWRGRAFGDLAYKPWARNEAERLEELRLECLEERIDADLELGREASVVAEIEALVREHPLRERPRGQLMLALYRSGRQAEALQAYQDARRVLVDELGVDPSPELRDLEAAILRQDASLSSAAAVTESPTNLPAPATPLVGREAELDELTALIERSPARLLTLTGPGGAGKTRLALALAARLRAQFPDGVYLSELASIDDPLLALDSIGQTLELEQAGAGSILEQLKTALRERKLLLVLDNLEQVLDIGIAIAQLLAGCPGLTVLVTSREPLHIAAEREHPVGPLSLAEARELFEQRARAIRPDFSTDGNVDAICERLDQLPLAIELAGARTRTFSPAAILERLDQSLPLLTGGPRDAPARHQTLTATIQWSYELLDEQPRLLLQRLAVFASQFTLADVETVCDGDLDTLASLVDKSLVVSRGDGCFAMLATVREFAASHLTAGDTSEKFHQRHARWVLAEIEHADAELNGQSQATALTAIAGRQDDARAALRWAVDQGDGGLARAMIAAVGWFWFLRSHLSEGRRWVDEVLALTVENEGEADGTAYMRAGAIAYSQGDLAAAQRFYSAGLSVRQRLGDRAGTAAALNNLGNVALHAGNYADGRRCYEESLEIARELGVPDSLGPPLHGMASAALAEGNAAAALPLLEESLAAAAATGNRYGEAVARGALAAARRDLGHLAEAASLLGETVRLQRELDERYGIASSLDELAGVASAAGDQEGAAYCLGAAAAIRDALGSDRAFADQQRATRTEASVRSQLGDDAYERIADEGRRLSIDAAIAFAEQSAIGSVAVIAGA